MIADKFAKYWGTLVTKFVADNFQNSPNLVTLLTTYIPNAWQIKIRVQRTLFAMSVKLQVSQFNGLASTKILQN